MMSQSTFGSCSCLLPTAAEDPDVDLVHLPKVFESGQVPDFHGCRPCMYHPRRRWMLREEGSSMASSSWQTNYSVVEALSGKSGRGLGGPQQSRAGTEND